MPIIFTVHHKDGYFTARYLGTISEEEVLKEHNLFFGGKEWNPGLTALVDFSRADLSKAANQVIRRLSEYFESILRTHNADSVKTAIYAPKDFSFGIGRTYGAMAAHSLQTVRVFRDLSDSKKWLEEGNKGIEG